MGSWIIENLSILILLFAIGRSVRISPKLNFGPDNNAGDSAKFRPTFQSESYDLGNRESVNNRHGADIACVNCNVPEKQSGVSTDLLVHVKTNVDVNGKNNSTEVVPDVPIIVGTKSHAFAPSNVPDSYDLPPVPISSIIGNSMQQYDRRTNNAPNYDSYPLEYKGSSSGLDLYFTNNEQNTNGFNVPLPQFTWHNPKRVDGSAAYNPLEFKKVYRNSWSDLPTKWTETSFPNNGQNPPPCVCPNPELQYPQRNPSRPPY